MRMFLMVVFIFGVVASSNGSDENPRLTKSIQKDLLVLGYQVDNVNGTLTTETRIAIGAAEEKYQMPITGNPSFGLATKTKAEVQARRETPCVSQTPVAALAGTDIPPTPRPMPNAECLQKQVDTKSHGKGNDLVSASTRILRRFGNKEVVDAVNDVSRTAADVVATTNDVETIADELDLTEDEVRECM